MVLVFQHGWFKSLLGFTETGPITSWVPLFMFVVLFGLSMDYHVFILSRVREAYDNGMKTEDAVSYAIKNTAGVVTSAAIVMVAVFAIFGSLSFIMFKQMGVGLAFAVLLDATLIRGVLLPATMKLLGDRNWWLPSKLGWLPEIKHEGEVQPARRVALTDIRASSRRPPSRRAPVVRQDTGSSQWRRSSIAARIRSPTWGISLQICRNACPVMTMALIGDRAVTVAFRAVPSMSPISPRKSPGPSSFRYWSPRITLALPSSMTRNSQASSPSRHRGSPGSSSTSSAVRATSRRSLLPSPANSGIPCSRASSIGSSSSRSLAMVSRAGPLASRAAT